MRREQFLSKYTIIRKLGSGANASVYLVWYERIAQYRAVKVIHKEKECMQTVSQEADILKRLKHPGIPVIYDIEEDEQNFYLIMEYMEGETVLSYYQKNRPIREQTIIKLAIQLCELIEYLHSQEQPVLYLDLKPENLMILDGQIRLIDFGTAICKKMEGEEVHSGTIGYAPPELFQRFRVDERADLYEIGMVLYYLMSGERGIVGPREDEEKLFKGYSKELLRVLRKTLKHSACERYQSVTQLKKKLKKLTKKWKVSDMSTSRNQTIVIALIGSEARIGVSHMAFCVLDYLRMSHQTAIYVEQNQRPILHRMVSQESINTSFADESYYIKYHGCKLTSAEWLDEEQLPCVRYVVKDLGAWQGREARKQREEFGKADIRLAVVGGKAWEMAASNQLIQELIEVAGVCFLVNSTTAKQFHQLIPRMLEKQFYRMPSIVDPFSVKENPMVCHLIEEVLDQG